MLGEKGLTSAEANRLANFIKERVKNIDITTDSFKIIKKVGTRGGEKLDLDNAERIDNWKALLLEKARLYSLSAWLREGISAKENAVNTVRAESFDSRDVVKEFKDEIPSKPCTRDVSFEFYFAEKLTVKEQNDYLTAEATASHVGKFIHSFDKLRSQMTDLKPVTFEKLSETEVMTVYNQMLYTEEELINDFESLQAIHREAERKLNGVKADFNKWVLEEERQYQIAMDEFESKYTAYQNSLNAKIQTARTLFEVEKSKKLEEAFALKIEIPFDQQPLVDELYLKLNA